MSTLGPNGVKFNEENLVIFRANIFLILETALAHTFPNLLGL